MSGDTQMIAEFAGIETAKMLLQYFDGLGLTIQKVKHMDSLLVKYLRVKYPGENYGKKDILRISKEIERSPRETVKLLRMR